MVTTSASLRVVGGRTLVGRLAIQLAAAGADSIEVVAPEGLQGAVREALQLAVPGGRWRVPTGRPEAREGLELVVDADRVLDPRILEHMLARERPCALVDDAGAGVGVAVVAGEDGGRGESDERADDSGAAPAGDRLCYLAGIPRYRPGLRRALDPYWIVVRTDADAQRARRVLADTAGKGAQEWLVLVLNRPVETWLSRWLCELAITPNQITVAGIAVALLATWQFARGHLGAGVLLALAAQIVDGLDGRQARIQLRFSPVGRLEHTLDKAVELSWIGALAWHFSGAGVRPVYLAGGAIWGLAAIVANAAGSLFRARRGVLPEQTTRIDALIRLVAARRNTNTAYLGIGLLLGYDGQVFWFLVALSAATVALLWLRVGILLSGHPAARLQ